MKNKLVSKYQKGNSISNVILGMVPIYGTYQDVKKAYDNPSLENIGWATASGIGDILFFTGLGSGIKSLKVLNQARKAKKLLELKKRTKAITAANKFEQAKMDRILDLNTSRDVTRARNSARQLNKNYIVARTKNDIASQAVYNKSKQLVKSSLKDLKNDVIIQGAQEGSNYIKKQQFGGYIIQTDNTRVNSPMLVTPIRRKLKPGQIKVHGAIITPKKETVKKDIKPQVQKTKSQKKNKFIDLFTNATIGAAVADNPSVMAASGWKQNKNNQWEQKPTKESKQLSENLSIISGLSPTHPATAVGDAIISKVAYPMYQIIKNKQLIPYVKSYLKHPTWETYYHGSPTSFDITQARMGTANDMGLHATKNRQVAKGFMEENPTGQVYKFRAPRYKATTSDLWANGVQNHLSTNYVIKKHALDGDSYGYFNILDKKLLNDLIKSKVPYKLTLDPNAAIIGKYNFAELKNASDITINPRSRFLEAIPKSKQAQFNQEANNLIELENKIDGYSESAKAARSKLNEAGTKLLDDYGITTVRYYNTNPREGIIDSYWINNPSKIDPVYNFKQIDIKPGSAILPSILITKSYNEK